MDSLALSKKGWVSFSELSIGQEILTLNIGAWTLEWKPVFDVNYYVKAPMMRIKDKEETFVAHCSIDHKWVVKNSFGYVLKEGRDLLEEDAILIPTDLDTKTLKATPYNNLDVKFLGREQPVWCPETSNRTWVMSQKGSTFLVGTSSTSVLYDADLTQGVKP